MRLTLSTALVRAAALLVIALAGCGYGHGQDPEPGCEVAPVFSRDAFTSVTLTEGGAPFVLDFDTTSDFTHAEGKPLSFRHRITGGQDEIAVDINGSVLTVFPIAAGGSVRRLIVYAQIDGCRAEASGSIGVSVEPPDSSTGTVRL